MVDLPSGTVSMLFSDVEQSTLLLTRLGSDYAVALDGCRKAQRSAWSGHGGVEMGTEGDSFFVVFTTAEDAVRAAVDAQVALGALELPNAERVRVRMGIHTGTPRIHEDGYVGIDVHRAARIAATAHGGQVVISDATAKLVAGGLPAGVSLRDLGDHRLKDLSEPERLHQLVIPGRDAEFPPLRSIGTMSSLPVTTTALVGREHDVGAAAALILSNQTRLVTLTGPGGVGKTRLAIAVAREIAPELPDGATFVSLAPVDNAAAAASVIAQGLGVLDTGDLPLEQKLVVAVGGRKGLLVLDNFEQVLDAAPLVGAMLHAAPELRILVTSRVLLHISGEHNYPVSPLEFSAPGGRPWQPGADVAPAVALFVQRARAVRPQFELTYDNVDAVERVAVALDGLPLAIELAAARIRLLPPASLLEQLDRQLSLLVGGPRDAPPRQRTVRDTIRWSAELLAEDEQGLLWRMGVFAGPTSLEAISTVAGDDETDTLRLLGTLVDASLVQPHESHDRPYFTLLATVREYALEQLEARGLLAQVRDQHARYYSEWGIQQRMGLLGPHQYEHLAMLTDQRDNVRAAAEHMVKSRDWESLADLSYSLYPYWWLVGLLGEVRGRLDALLGSGDPVSDRATAIALWLSSIVSFFQGSDESVRESLARGARLFAAAGDVVGEGTALTSLGLAYATEEPPDLARAKEALQRGVQLLREAGDTWSESVTIIPLGRLYLLEGDIPSATEQFSRALQLAEADENDFAIAVALNSLGWMELFTGRVVEAATTMERALDLCIGLSYEHGIAYQLESLLGVAGVLGDPEKAGLLGGAALTLRERLGLLNPRDAVLHLGIVEEIRNGTGADLYERAFQHGRGMSVDEAIAVARAVTAAATAVPPAS